MHLDVTQHSWWSLEAIPSVSSLGLDVMHISVLMLPYCYSKDSLMVDYLEKS